MRKIKKQPVGAIAGGTSGGVVGLLAVTGLLWLLWRRRREAPSTDTAVEEDVEKRNTQELGALDYWESVRPHEMKSSACPELDRNEIAAEMDATYPISKQGGDPEAPVEDTDYDSNRGPLVSSKNPREL